MKGRTHKSPATHSVRYSLHPLGILWHLHRPWFCARKSILWFSSNYQKHHVRQALSHPFYTLKVRVQELGGSFRVGFRPVQLQSLCS
jgi:hypothetical protein